MHFTKCFVVLLALIIGGICQSKIVIKTSHLEESAKLEEAALKILKNCYEHQQKEAVVSGDFPENFIKSLSSYRSFSLILMDDKRRTEKVQKSVYEVYETTQHNINLVIVSASNKNLFKELMLDYILSRYHDASAAYLVLDWSPKNKDTICNEKRRTYEFMFNFGVRAALNLKVMCNHRLNGTMIYHSSVYLNQIPKPWKVSAVFKIGEGRTRFYLLEQQYREYETMCKNLDFDKTHNLGGCLVTILVPLSMRKLEPESPRGTSKEQPQRALNIGLLKRWSLFAGFFKYLNATQRVVSGDGNYLNMNEAPLIAMYKTNRGYAYPFTTLCKCLWTKFRGYKSQWQKMIDVIDIYSWLATYGVVIVTLLFFKYFLRQPLIVGILNVTRLISNAGLTTVPQNLPPQIYLSCLLCFVVTMQGIFVSNLAALLTQDIPVRQVNTLQDLIDLDYTTYIASHDESLFDRPEFKGRLIIVKDTSIGSKNLYDPSKAFLYYYFHKALTVRSQNFYASPNCIVHEYTTNAIPRYWAFENTFNEYRAMRLATNTLLPFDIMVDEKRLIELQSEQDDPEPRVIKFTDLMFAFIILGCGLSIAFVTFIAELLIHRYQHKVKKTRVIVLN